MLIDAQLKPLPGGGILYDAARIRNPDPGVFTRGHWEASGSLRQITGGRGAVSFIRPGTQSTEPGDAWVLRHYRRGGLVAKLLHDTYLWMGAERTRSFREWRLLATLHERGLPVPAPVAARYVRSGLVYRADLITRELPSARTLAQSIDAAPLSPQQWQVIGGVIALFHRHGVQHADLNAHNILLDSREAVFVLDFDRGRIRARGRWEQDVLARLRRSLEKVAAQNRRARFSEQDWRELLMGYAQQEGDPQTPDTTR